MIVLRSLAMAFSCFSILPMPQLDWDEANMRYMMAAFPVVGVFIGVCVWLWSMLCDAMGFGMVLQAAGMTLLPVLLSGAIHLDGFADVIDAASSHADAARRRQILKDPHVGVFAVVGVCCYLLAYFACATEVRPAHILALACIPVVSRCLSGFATVSFAGSAKDGMLAAERASSSAGVVRLVIGSMAACVAALLVWQDALVGVAMLGVAVLALACVKWYADRAFGGMSGDMAGFFLQCAELAMLVVIVIAR